MNDSNSVKKSISIAVIGPSFFSYARSIADQINFRKYPCTYYDELHSNKIFIKILYRFGFSKLVEKNRFIHFENIKKDIFSKKVTDIFLVNVEAVKSDFILYLKSREIRVHLYMWDSLQNKNTFLDLLPLLDGRASFEPADCKTLGMKYIPLFAESMFKSTNKIIKNRQIVFIGTLHSKRASIIAKLEEVLNKSGIVIKKLIYYPSKILYFIKCFGSPRDIKYILDIQTKPFTKEFIAKTYFESAAVLDIHHPGQKGLTSRTFEALRSGCRLVTMNSTIFTLPELLLKRVTYIEQIDDLENYIQCIDENLPELTTDEDYFLSIERFVDQLLEIAEISPQNENI